MKKAMKKVVTMFLLCVFMAGSAGGCSKNITPQEGEETPAASEKITIPFWLVPPGEQATKNFWEDSIAAFNETNTDNIFIDLQYVPSDAYDSKLKAAQANGTAPQLVYVGHAGAIMDGSQGLLKPLNDYIDPALLEDLYPNIREMITTKDGKFYSIPMYVEPYSLLFYRKDLFEAAGLDPDQPPKTYDELLDYAKRLTNNQTFGLGIAGSNDAGWVNWAAMSSIGLNLISEDWSKATVNNDISKKYLELHKELYSSKVVPEQALGEFWDIQPLAEGRLAMQFNGSWAISRLLVDLKDVVDPENIGIALTPTFTGLKEGDKVGALGGWGLGIDGKAKNPEAVAKVISYLLLENTDRMAQFVSDGYYAKLPVRQSVNDLLTSKEDDKKVEEWYNLIVEKVIPYSDAEPVFPWDVSWAFVVAMDNVIVNGMSTEDALAQCEKDINDYIQNNNIAGTNPK